MLTGARAAVAIGASANAGSSVSAWDSWNYSCFRLIRLWSCRWVLKIRQVPLEMIPGTLPGLINIEKSFKAVVYFGNRAQRECAWRHGLYTERERDS